MSQLKTKLIAGLFVPALALAGAAFANDTSKMTGDKSAAGTAGATSTTANTANPSTSTTTNPATSTTSPSTSTSAGTKSTMSTDAFARLDTNHDGKLSAADAPAAPNVQAMCKKLAANHDGTVSEAEFAAHAADLK